MEQKEFKKFTLEELYFGYSLWYNYFKGYAVDERDEENLKSWLFHHAERLILSSAAHIGNIANISDEDAKRIAEHAHKLSIELNKDK